MKSRQIYYVAIGAILVTVLGSLSEAFAAVTGVALESSYYYRRRGFACGYINGTWEPGTKKRDGLFYSVSAQIADLEAQLATASRSRLRRLQRNIRSLQARRARANSKLCSSLAAPQVVTSLAQLPSPSSLVSGTASVNSITPLVVSGTPPRLSQMASASLENLFWRAGVISGINSGTPTEQQCSEFWGGFSDGESGGMGSCFMAQGVGYSFEPILRSGTSLCYMKNAPTQQNVNAGAVSLVSGILPNGDITQLFATPLGSVSRLVKVQISGDEFSESGFIRVYSAGENRINSNNYAFDIYFCRGNSQTPSGYEQTRITTGNLYSAINKEAGDFGSHIAQISAYITKDSNGNVTFDSAKARSATVNFVQPSQNISFKADMLVSGDNFIKVKNYEIFNTNVRKSYSVSGFAGSSIQNLEFLQGVYKDSNSNDGGLTFSSVTIPIEYRDTYYAIAPSSALLPELNAVDINTDVFYSTPASVNIDTSAYSCLAQPDIVVSMNMSNPALQSVAAICEGDRLDGMNFCFDNETVSQAMNNFYQYCMQH